MKCIEKDLNLRGADLRHADMRGADLRNADLYAANLRGADLRDAVLYDAVLCDAQIDGATLGVETYLGALLRLAGACSESVVWAEKQKHGQLDALLVHAKEDWRAWLKLTLRCEPTPEALLSHVYRKLGWSLQ